MGEARARGTYEQRKAQAIKAGRASAPRKPKPTKLSARAVEMALMLGIPRFVKAQEQAEKAAREKAMVKNAKAKADQQEVA